jgi:hypothetical protein
LGDLLVVVTLGGGQDQPLSAVRPARQMHEHFPLAFGEYDRLRPWPRHSGHPLRVALLLLAVSPRQYKYKRRETSTAML